MKKEELYAILGEVDEKYLVEEKQPYSKKTLFLKWGSLVAGFTVIVVTALAVLPSYFNEKKGVVLEDVMKPATDESYQQENSSENYISMKQIHMNYLLEVGSNTESDKSYYDPALYDELKWDKEEILEYYGKDLTPAYIPEGLMASAKNNTELTVFRKKDGEIARDLLWLDFYNDYYEDGSPKLTENIAAPKGITVKASKFSFGGCQKQDTFDVKIHVPSGSTEEFVYSHEEISPKRKTIKIRIEDRADENAFGITLTANNIMPTGMTLKCSQSGSKISDELYTGSWFVIEKWTQKDGWKEVKYNTTEEIAWTEEAWVVPLNDTVEWEVSWDWIYGKLPKSRYRIGKEFVVTKENNQSQQVVYYAEFEILEE